MRKKHLLIICIMIIMSICMSVPACGEQQDALAPDADGKPFAYRFDPMKDPDAAKDIIVNPKAVYGYSPNPESKRLGPFAKFDWTDKEFVAESRQTRLEYFKDTTEMIVLAIQLYGEGKSVEEIARAVSALRNQLRIRSCKTEEEKETVKKSNLDKYGNEEGPTADSLFEKYGKWEIVLLKAFSFNPGMDACTGLYDHTYKYRRFLQNLIDKEKAA